MIFYAHPQAFTPLHRLMISEWQLHSLCQSGNTLLSYYPTLLLDRYRLHTESLVPLLFHRYFENLWCSSSSIHVHVHVLQNVTVGWGSFYEATDGTLI